MELTQEYLKECLEYDPETGRLVWKERPVCHFVNEVVCKRWNGKLAGKQAGSRTQKGYTTLRIARHPYLAHRVIWRIIWGAWPVEQLDHINGDKSDNRLGNLREASNAENCRNKKAHRNNKLGYKGVTRGRENKFHAEIALSDRRVYLGTFSSPEAAHAAYCRAADNYFGVFANYGNVGAHNDVDN